MTTRISENETEQEPSATSCIMEEMKMMSFIDIVNIAHMYYN